MNKISLPKLSDESNGLTESILETMSTSFDAITGYPITGLTKQVLKNFGSLDNYFFAKRLLIFLDSVESLRPSEKIKLKKMLYVKDGLRAGEVLLEQISKLDDDRKAILLAELAIGLARNELTKEKFIRFCDTVRKSYFNDLLLLHKFGSESYINGTAESLFSYGLITIESSDYGDLRKTIGSMNTYSCTPIGHELNKYVQKARKNSLYLKL